MTTTTITSQELYEAEIAKFSEIIENALETLGYSAYDFDEILATLSKTEAFTFVERNNDENDDYIEDMILSDLPELIIIDMMKRINK